MSFEGICLRERDSNGKPIRVKISNPKFQVHERGTIMVKGACPKCGGPISTFIGAKDAPADIRQKAEKIRADRKKKAESSKKGGSSKSSSRKSRGSRKASKKSSSRR